MKSDLSGPDEGDDLQDPEYRRNEQSQDASADSPAAHSNDDQEDADLLGEMPVFSQDAPEELLQWLSLSLNQLRRRSGRLGQNVSIVDKLLSSLKGLRLVGYGMAALVILDFSGLLLGAQIMNPAWEWTFFGGMVERSAVLLLGVALVFLGHENLRGNMERYFLQAVYWGSLAAGLAYLLMLPLGVANSFRLQTYYEQQYDSTFSAVEQQYQQILTNISAAQSAATSQSPSLDGQQQAQLEAATSQAAKQANQLKQQAAEQLTRNKEQLRRQSLSWLGGSLLVGIIFLVLWQQARWVRHCKPQQVIRPWLQERNRKIKKKRELTRKKHASRTKASPQKKTILHTTPGPGAQTGLKPGISRKRNRQRSE